jgi:hypothetical protein
VWHPLWVPEWGSDHHFTPGVGGYSRFSVDVVDTATMSVIRSTELSYFGPAGSANFYTPVDALTVSSDGTKILAPPYVIDAATGASSAITMEPYHCRARNLPPFVDATHVIFGRCLADLTTGTVTSDAL